MNTLICIEFWKDIPGYEGIYQASTYGRIRTAPNKTTHSILHGMRKWQTRILKGRGDNPQTGKRVSLWKNKKPKDWLVARLVAITFLGFPTNNGFTVNHIDGNRMNNNVSNLEWLSIANNIRHAFLTGLMPSNIHIELSNSFKQKRFISLSRASKYIGRNPGYISLCLKNKRKIIGSDSTEYAIRLCF